MKAFGCLLLVGLISRAFAGYVFVVAPNTFRFDHDETIVIGVFQETNLAVQVWLEIDGVQPFSHINNVNIQDESHPQNHTVRIRENNLFPQVGDNSATHVEKPRTVKIVTNSTLGRQETTVSLSYNTGYLFVQTDKPVYTPRKYDKKDGGIKENKVRVRTLVLDETLKPAPQLNITMDLISPSGLTMARVRNNKHEEFIKYSFPLPPKPELGIWTIKAFCAGQLETDARATFEVREYVLPRFGVAVDVNIPYILEAELRDIQFTVTVTAEYVYKKKVKGTSGLSLYLKKPDDNNTFILEMERLPLENGISEYGISGSDIFNSPTIKDKPFPTGLYLECRADVLEEVTGNTEWGSHSQAIFAVDKFIFDFSRSKTTYHPGMQYHLKLDILYANGEPAAKEHITLQAEIDGDQTHDEKQTTNGYVAALINTKQHDSAQIRIQVKAGANRSAIFHVDSYKGENQIQVEHIIKDEDSIMRAFSNVQGGQYTGMLFVIVSRGKIVYFSYQKSANVVGVPVSDVIKRAVSPSARMLVFYVDTRTNKVVADSVKFNVDPVCRGPGLSFHLPTEPATTPGSPNVMTIAGTPGMKVGINVMDKALLLLKRDSVMRRSHMFEAMESHDMGCGAGSGQNSEDIFKNAGLALVGNLAFKPAQPVIGCADHPVRNKRSQGCFANDKCCEFGKEFATNQIYESADKLDPYLTCYPKARELQQGDDLPMKCILAFFEECVEEIKYSSGGLLGRSLGSGSDYQEDIRKLLSEPMVRTDFRESWLFDEITLDNKGTRQQTLLYPDSITEWMIQGIGVSPENGLCIAEPLNVTVFKPFFLELDVPYKAVRMEHLDVKATIFNYGNEKQIVSVYLQGTSGICSNVRPGQQSRRRKITVGPNSAETVRFPIVLIEAANKYIPITATAIVMQNQVSTSDAVEKNLYVVNEGVEEKIAINLCLGPKHQMEACSNHPRIKTSWLHDEQTAIVDLSLPDGHIPNSGSATAYLSANIMTAAVETVLDDVEKLFVMPSGCGEQVAAKLAPTVYATSYLKRTKQVAPEIEEKSNNFVRHGVIKQYGSYFQKETDGNGGYAAYKSRPPSTWLSAFVVKVFCQAKDAVDDAVEEDIHVIPTIKWLMKNVVDDGSFLEANSITGWGIGVGLMGNMGIADVALTPFVLISLTECSGRVVDGLDHVYEDATRYVETIPSSTLTRNPYLLAISTYALALAESPEKWNFRKLLMQSSISNADGMHWGDQGEGLANSASVETTGYALLATMLFDDMKTSANIVRWLTAQWETNGAFRSTQDTVVALQALSTYSRRTDTQDTHLVVELFATEWKPKSETITNEHRVVRSIINELPVERKDNKLNVKISGKGTARMVIDLRYNRPRYANETCQFDVSDIKIKPMTMDRVHDILDPVIRRCDVCGFCEDDPDMDQDDYDDRDKYVLPPVDSVHVVYSDSEAGVTESSADVDVEFGRKKRQAGQQQHATKEKVCVHFSVQSRTDQEYGMSIVEFGLETGMTVVEDDLKKMETDGTIDRYEMPESGKGYVIFYLKKIGVNKTSFTFRLKDTFSGDLDSRHPATINVYDYYKPENKCKKYYGTGPNNGHDPFLHKCNDKKEGRNCKCIQSTCSRSRDQTIIELGNKAKEAMKRKKNKKNIVFPAPLLAKRTCDNRKADFAVFVKITSTGYDQDTLQRHATGIVLRHIHKGAFNLKSESKLKFYWNMSCTYPNLQKGKKYWIIAKDGVKHGKDDIRCQLMDTALVVEKKGNKNHTLTRVMLAYERIMKQGCFV